MNAARLLAVARKEVMHLLRDPFSIAMAFGFPLILVLYFGFAIDFDFSGVKLALYDFDHSRQSRTLAETFTSSGYFTIEQGRHPGRLLTEVETEKDFGVVIIPPGFGRSIADGKQAEVQVLVDGTDNQKTGVVGRYIGALQRAVTDRFVEIPQRQTFEIRTRFLYNPELKTSWFIVPGLIVVVIGLLAIFMTALTVAREWENGSMEMLLATPVQPVEIVLGKIVPYVGIGLCGAALVYLVARIVFGVPFAGSHVALALAVVLFIIAALAQGIVISVTMRQQSKATQVALIVGLLPSLLLSGLIFPVESMPVFFRYLTAILPARWFMVIIRGLFLKGAGISELAVPFAALVVLTVLPLAVAAKKFKRDLEP